MSKSNQYKDYEKQSAGCGCSDQSNQKKQSGGAYKQLNQQALSKAAAWRQEVKQIQQSEGVTYREAISIASERRKQDNPNYRTMKQRYVDHLDDIRQEEREYQPYGSKNKRPLSLQAAQRILLQYYRNRAEQYQRGPLSAMRKNISSCHKEPNRTLKTCPPNIKSRQQAQITAPECSDSWKYRPGKYAKGATGPGYYDMDGLNNLCGPKNAQARKDSDLYNMKFMHKKKKQSTQKGGNSNNQDKIKNPLTGRLIKVGGDLHQQLIEQGHL